MLVIPKPRRRYESVISQTGVAKQVRPFDDLNDATEFAAQLLNAATTIRCRAPAICMNFKLTNDVGDNVTVEYTIVGHAHAGTAKIENLTLLEAVAE
jgi:hypothetical protein